VPRQPRTPFSGISICLNCQRYPYRQVLKWSGTLNVRQSSFEVLQFLVNFLDGFVCRSGLGKIQSTLGAQDRATTYRLGLECLDGLDMTADIIGDWLEILESLLGLVDNRLVL
jgi:hypothetical protein